MLRNTLTFRFGKTIGLFYLFCMAAGIFTIAAEKIYYLIKIAQIGGVAGECGLDNRGSETGQHHMGGAVVSGVGGAMVHVWGCTKENERHDGCSVF